MSTRNVTRSIIDFVFTDIVHVPALQHGLQHQWQQSNLIKGRAEETGNLNFAERRINLWRKLNF